MHDAEQGAFTGEISAGMLKAEEVDFVLLGHSERRTLFGESNEFIRRKLQRALAAELTVVLCLGETDEERASGRTQAVLGTQMRECLAGVSAQQMQRIVIAYEPVWAIGTGKSATAEQAQEVHAFCRHQIASLFAKEAAVACKLLYGGSVKAQNATKLMEQPDIDGALVGGASLTVQEFVNIISQLRSA